jgi:H+/gluconate symporter-like permease
VHFGTTASEVGILIALGAMFAKLLADSGGADEIVDTIVGHASPRALPWAMALVGAIIGLPLSFEIGLVLLMPVIYLVAKRSQLSLITVGIPALTGLSAMHGLVPPHPGPLTAIDLLGADLGSATPAFRHSRPPVDGAVDRSGRRHLHAGPRRGDDPRSDRQVPRDVAPPVAGITLIVAAGGGFKQVLVDSGIGTLLADWAKGAHVSAILLAWVLAALIRLATGSATATITASSLILGLVAGMSTGQVSLVVLAVGAGSLFFSHVNDAGFWLVKEFFGMTVGQTIKSWSMMETVLSVTGLVLVLLLGIVV